ncbi:MAG: S49 family peptidase, partial [Sandaracinaceae bacterium]|nr:S49 family peptidase [Sandaracinaceae bacterium]
MVRSVFGLLGRLLFNFWRLLTAPLWWLARYATKPRARWVHVRLRSRIAEIEKPPPFFMRWVPGFDEARPTSLTTLRELAGMVVEDPRIEGVVFDVPLLAAGWATCQSLRQVLVGLRERGRKVAVYLPQGASNREIYVASAADRILAGPHTQIAPLGLAASFTYVKGLLGHAGVSVEVHRRAEYKTAAELATNDAMSEPQREQTQALLDTLDGALREALGARMGLGAEGVDALFSAALLDADEAREKGLV